eukprot:GDKK01052332.1.p1 GENE.GDKK01052332.1~~GDKK01052332.1.p1  ORF type:complete len:159 (-),score=16.19 GDKK01052332.1:92-568(-)
MLVQPPKNAVNIPANYKCLSFSWTLCHDCCLYLPKTKNDQSFGGLKKLIRGEPAHFAICFTLGNIISLLATFFIAGPKSQFKKMAKAHRRVASLMYISSMILTIVLVCVQKHAAPIVISCILQWSALWWYCLSLIPFGRRIAKHFCSRCFKFDDEQQQ